MKQGEIKLASGSYTIVVTCGVVESVMDSLSIDDFDQLSEYLDPRQVRKYMKLKKTAIYEMIKKGCQFNKVEFPFESVEQLNDQIESFEESSKAAMFFSERTLEWFGFDTEKLGELLGQGNISPSPLES